MITTSTRRYPPASSKPCLTASSRNPIRSGWSIRRRVIFRRKCAPLSTSWSRMSAERKAGAGERRTRGFLAFVLVHERDTEHLESLDLGKRRGGIGRNQADHRSRDFPPDHAIDRFGIARRELHLGGARRRERGPDVVLGSRLSCVDRDIRSGEGRYRLRVSFGNNERNQLGRVGRL